LNPAVGLTFTPSRTLNVYAGYSEGSRAPTSIELGCADPTEPCKLPNALAGDPPLDQVVVSTWEAGLRGGTGQMFNWNIGAFRAANRHDILFVASTQTGFGYFRNFGETRRQGLEAGVSGRVGHVTVGGGYTFLDATYQSAETVDGSGNSSNDAAVAGVRGLDGTIQIQPGDRIPLIPRHMVKAFADVRITTKASLDLNLVGVSSSYARGNENNQDQPDGTYYIGAGSVPGYGVVNLGARYQATHRVQLIAEINNLFDTRYDTAAQLGATGFTGAGAFIARPFPAVGGEFPVQRASFVAPGAPRTGWVGARVAF
jgi:outer membrane receptor protein involved in Fe transport